MPPTGWSSSPGGAGAGFDELCLADTIGVGTPTQVRELTARVREAVGGQPPLRYHFHNTRNTGFANAFAAIIDGVAVLDASAGGIGGCPFAPNATGNIATDDLVYMFDRMGLETGLDLQALLPTRPPHRTARPPGPAMLPRPGRSPERAACRARPGAGGLLVSRHCGPGRRGTVGIGNLEDQSMDGAAPSLVRVPPAGPSSGGDLAVPLRAVCAATGIGQARGVLTGCGQRRVPRYLERLGASRRHRPSPGMSSSTSPRHRPIRPPTHRLPWPDARSTWDGVQRPASPTNTWTSAGSRASRQAVRCDRQLGRGGRTT